MLLLVRQKGNTSSVENVGFGASGSATNITALVDTDRVELWQKQSKSSQLSQTLPKENF